MPNMGLREFDLALFHWIGGAAPGASLLQEAAHITQWAPWLCVALALGAVVRQPKVFGYVMAAAALCALSSPVAQLIAAELASPRPFALGLVPNHIGHGQRGGMPSTHATAIFTMAFMLLLQANTRVAGIAVAALALATGWARVYLGVHFPMDIAAGAMLAAVMVGAAACVAPGLNSLRNGRSLARVPPLA